MNAVSRPSTTVDLPEDYAAAAERFAAAVGATDLRAPVPACPGWSAYDLVVHLGNVHAWAATIVETGRRAAEQNDRPRSSRARSVREWYLAKAEDLYQVLQCIPSDRPCWNFVFGEGVADFWRRRQLHETTVHRIDLDTVAGRVSDPAPEVAVDGVSEVLEVMLTRALQRGHRLRLDAPVQLVATDTGDSWVVSPLQRSRPGVPREASGSPPGRRADQTPPPSVEHRCAATTDGGGSQLARHDVPDRVEAPAHRLYRTLWHRSSDLSALRLSGDEARVRAFLGSQLTP